MHGQDGSLSCGRGVLVQKPLLTSHLVCFTILYVKDIYLGNTYMCEHENSDEGEYRCKVERVPNFSQPRLLLELAKKPAHGYELIERLGQIGSLGPDPGNFYRMLRSLEQEGLVCSTWDTQNAGPARRVYELTEQGLEYLHTWAITIQQTRACLERFLSEYQTLFP